MPVSDYVLSIIGPKAAEDTFNAMTALVTSGGGAAGFKADIAKGYASGQGTGSTTFNGVPVGIGAPAPVGFTDLEISAAKVGFSDFLSPPPAAIAIQRSVLSPSSSLSFALSPSSSLSFEENGAPAILSLVILGALLAWGGRK